MQAVQRREDGERSGRVFVLAAVAVAALIGVYFAAGMPGMDHSGGAMTDMEHESPSELEVLTPRVFEARIVEDDVFVVNVHVPVGESIDGTDETIAFDEIIDSKLLPTDKATPILLYCETGRMSATAGRSLLQAGYLSVGHLAGGLEAWRRADLQLTAIPQLAR